MTLEKGAADWPECKSYTYTLDTVSKPRHERNFSARSAWLKLAAEMPINASYDFENNKEAQALIEAIHITGFAAKLETNIDEAKIFKVYKLDKEK